MTTPLLVIDGDTARQLAPVGDLIPWVREAMRITSRGDVELPLRRALALPDERGMLGIMPGYMGENVDKAGVKLVSLVPPELRLGSSHLGLIVLYDADGLLPVAILCGATITAIRTAAASAVATDVLARHDASVLAILGAGEQALAHAKAMTFVRKFTEVRLWARDPGKAAVFARTLANEDEIEVSVHGSVKNAVNGADVVCTVTGASQPFLSGSVVGPGTHVNLVGSSHRAAREVDSDLVLKSEFFIDYRPSIMDQAGELLHAIDEGLVDESHIRAEIGDVINGDARGRSGPEAITVYK